MTDDEFQLSGTLIEEKYRVDDAIARGGFGVVYRGEQVRLKRPVALKVLAWDGGAALDAEEIAAQFLAEAELLAQLDHPAIVRVLDVGSTRTPKGRVVPWMALEWVEGRTLHEDLHSRSADARRDPAECLALMRPVIEALAQAHAHGVVHRDIKPSNIMLVTPPKDAARAAGRPTVRLLDFGIAKVMAPDEARPVSGNTETASKTTAFSARYAAPEQISGSRTGPWTDVHAVGLVLTHLLTMRFPYPGEDALSMAARALSDTRPTPRALRVDVGAWERVLAKALALHPSDRYPDAGALLGALEAALPESRSVSLDAKDDHTSTPELQIGPERTLAPAHATPVAPKPVAPRSAREDAAAVPPPLRTWRYALAALAAVLASVLLWRVVGGTAHTDPTRAPTLDAAVIATPVLLSNETDARVIFDVTATLDAAPSHDAAVALDSPSHAAVPREHGAAALPLRARRDAGPLRTTVAPLPL